MDELVYMVDDDLFRVHVEREYNVGYSAHLNTWARESWQRIAGKVLDLGYPCVNQTPNASDFVIGNDREFGIAREVGAWPCRIYFYDLNFVHTLDDAERLARSLVIEYRRIAFSLTDCDLVRSANLLDAPFQRQCHDINYSRGPPYKIQLRDY